jgi:DNA polymerase III delta prime subunit
MYRKQRFASMVLEHNASDDRGIDVIREQIKEFASALPCAKATKREPIQIHCIQVFVLSSLLFFSTDTRQMWTSGPKLMISLFFFALCAQADCSLTSHPTTFPFCPTGTRQMWTSAPKLIILDEADNMTSVAQMALRRVRGIT